MSIGIDPSIQAFASHLAIAAASDMNVELEEGQIDALAVALQRAFEDWASVIEPKAGDSDAR